MKYLLVFGFLFTHSPKAFAIREVVFRGEVKVYKNRDIKSEVVGIYNRGDVIPVSNIKYGAWRKVIVDHQGKRRIGWFRVADAKGAKIRVRAAGESLDPNRPSAKVYKRYNGAGIFGSLAYTYQTSGEVDFKTAFGDFTADYNSATGVNFFFGFFGDFNLSDTMTLRGYLSMRSMKRSGTGKIKTGAGQERDFRLEQDMITLGSTLKMYKNSSANFWWGPGLEIGKSTDFKFISDKREIIDNDINAEITDDPLYVFLSISAGYDMHIAGSFFLLPEVKLSVIPNGDPAIANLEVWVPLSYSF